jgi:hypothetical protein
MGENGHEPIFLLEDIPYQLDRLPQVYKRTIGVQAAQKDFRGKARENRRAEVYVTSTLERGDRAPALNAYLQAAGL